MPEPAQQPILDTVFLGVPLVRSQTTSQTFKDHGAHNVAPATVSEVKVSGIRLKPNNTIILALAQLWAFVASIILNNDIVLTSLINVMLVDANYPSLVATPLLIITFRQVSEKITHELEAIGFSKQTTGKYRYFRGPSTKESLRDVSVMDGAEPDSYCPKGNVSIHGLMAFYVINQILTASFAVLGSSATLTPSLDDPIPKREFESSYITQANLDTLPTNGIYFPYFDGLLLPDRAIITWFISTFSCILGQNRVGVANSSSILASGWSSLHNTPAGKAFSHMFFMVRLAQETGFTIRPVFLNNEYCGVVVCGQEAVLVNQVLVKSVAKMRLQEQIEAQMSHDSALQAIVEIASALENKAEDVVLTTEICTTPRRLSLLINKKKLTPAAIGAIRPHLRKLKFPQKFWEVNDTPKIKILIECLCRGTELSETAPLYFTGGDAMFTNEVSLRSLSAFGVQAPSLLGFSNNFTKPFTKEIYSKADKPGNLSGIPIFKKPCQEAYEDWKKVFADWVVFFGVAGKDKMGRMRVKGESLQVVFGTDDEKGIMDALCTKKGLEKREKRKRETEAEGSGVVDEEVLRKRKERRVKGFGFMALPGIVPGAGNTEDDAEMQDDGFF